MTKKVQKSKKKASAAAASHDVTPKPTLEVGGMTLAQLVEVARQNRSFLRGTLERRDRYRQRASSTNSVTA